MKRFAFQLMLVFAASATCSHLQTAMGQETVPTPPPSAAADDDATAQASDDTAQASDDDEAEETQVIQATGSPFQFELRNGKRFTGFIDASNDVKLLIIGNEIKLPPNAIRSISFDSGNQGRVRVALMNGDGLSGQLMDGRFSVMADWGELKINNNALMRVTRVERR